MRSDRDSKEVFLPDLDMECDISPIWEEKDEIVCAVLPKNYQGYLGDYSGISLIHSFPLNVYQSIPFSDETHFVSKNEFLYEIRTCKFLGFGSLALFEPKQKDAVLVYLFFQKEDHSFVEFIGTEYWFDLHDVLYRNEAESIYELSLSEVDIYQEIRTTLPFQFFYLESDKQRATLKFQDGLEQEVYLSKWIRNTTLYLKFQFLPEFKSGMKVEFAAIMRDQKGKIKDSTYILSTGKGTLQHFYSFLMFQGFHFSLPDLPDDVYQIDLVFWLQDWKSIKELEEIKITVSELFGPESSFSLFPNGTEDDTLFLGLQLLRREKQWKLKQVEKMIHAEHHTRIALERRIL